MTHANVSQEGFTGDEDNSGLQANYLIEFEIALKLEMGTLKFARTIRPTMKTGVFCNPRVSDSKETQRVTMTPSTRKGSKSLQPKQATQWHMEGGRMRVVLCKWGKTLRLWRLQVTQLGGKPCTASCRPGGR